MVERSKEIMEKVENIIGKNMAKPLRHETLKIDAQLNSKNNRKISKLINSSNKDGGQRNEDDYDEKIKYEKDN